MAEPRTILVVMGVSGSGKTTIATALAQHLGWPFKDGDELHPAANIAKMRSGHALDDQDRWPWLARIADWIDAWQAAGSCGVITCSALKRSYREFLTKGRPAVLFVYLHGDVSLIATRLAPRSGHFMPSDLLASQFAALQEPGPEEHAIRVEIDQPVSEIVAAIAAALRQL
ncbi:MAG: gluconokinase [Xanthobacteraceae bacterium]|nr:gluconokinase [Xanthobacteraceae bacterium]